MPLVLILLGAVLLTVAWRGTEHDLAQQLTSDFGTGGPFLAWAAAIVALGAIGYFRNLRHLSDLAMALVIVVLVLTHQGIWQQLASAVNNPPAALPSVPLASYTGGGTLASNGAGGPTAGTYASNIGTDAAAGATVGGPYGAAAGAAYGAISTAF